MAATPQPPSLQLPRPIQDLTASRTGNQVSLQWNTPSENTDKLKLKGMVQLRICRQQDAAPCQTIATISAAPGKPAHYAEELPAALARGPLRPLSYRIFGINKHGQTAGPSNVAAILAGEAPPQIQNLSLQVVERGVVLRWQPVSDLPAGTSIEIDRTLVTPAPAKSANAKKHGLLSPPTEPIRQKLRLRLHAAAASQAGEVDPGKALDASAILGREYIYKVSRIVQRNVDKRTLEISGAPSAPVNVVTRDTFPPRPPSDLVAVPVSAAINNGAPEVDLSWSANTEPDLAYYRVYRSDGTHQEPMRQIAPANGAEPIVAPAFRDMHVQPGHTYIYAVTAVDTAGNESARSQPVHISVPTF